MTLKTRFYSCAALITAMAVLPAVATPARHVEAELIAEHTALAENTVNWLALRLKPEAGWHTYWRNSGDAGYATSIKWTLPGHARAGDIVWPAPELHKLGELTTYGYGEETLHLIPVKLSGSQPVDFKAEAKWLVCKDVCVPESAMLTLSLPVSRAPQADARWTSAFAQARALLPKTNSELKARYAVAGKDLSLQIDGLPVADNATAEFFPYDNGLLNHSDEQRTARDQQALRFTQGLSTYFTAAPKTVEGVMVLTQGQRREAYELAAVAGFVEPVAQQTAAQTLSLGSVLLFALLGGLILNLMPCVFPVLSLKALAVMQARDQHHAHRRHALAYTAGVVLSCAAVAGVLIGLRAGGEALGWGFQLQSPLFVGLLAYLMFALGLSLSGVTELGTGLMNLGNSLTQSRGLAGSFFTGVLALVVASPCTAPFMGTALGFALTQPAVVSLLIFCTLGLGLALPFLLLGFFPQLAAALPRPGAWMERFRQLMAFPLYLTAVWLLWVLTRQAGADSGAAALVGLVLIAFALWLPAGKFSRVFKLAALAAALALLFLPTTKPAAPTQTGGAEKWSEARVAELRAEGRTIFVDFTADWCLTCKVNERVALHTDAVKAAFAKNNVAYLVADWTNPDPAITKALTDFERAGVPLYLVYVRGGDPQILPQILTPDIVLSSLEK